MQPDIGRISVRDTKLVVASKKGLARATPDVTIFCTSRGPSARAAPSYKFYIPTAIAINRKQVGSLHQERGAHQYWRNPECDSHFTAVFGNVMNQVNELISIATGYGGDFCVLGCDGSADNTGKLDRVVRNFGLTRRRASTLVCLQDLHADELSHESLLKNGRWDNRDAVLHWASRQDRQRPCLPSACRSV